VVVGVAALAAVALYSPDNINGLFLKSSSSSTSTFVLDPGYQAYLQQFNKNYTTTKQLQQG